MLELVLAKVELGLARVEHSYLFGSQTVTSDRQSPLVPELEVPVGMVHAVEPQQNGSAQMQRVLYTERTHGHHQQQFHHLKRPQKVLALQSHTQVASQRKGYSLVLIAMFEADVG